MKKLALVFLGFFLYFWANAQFERVVPENGYTRFLRTLKGDYVVVYNSKSAEAFNEKGETIMNLHSFDPIGGYDNAFDLSDTSVVFTGWGFSFDGWGWWGTPGYRKFNSNWQDDAFTNYFDEGSTNTEKTIDTGFVSYYDESIYRYDADASKLWEFYGTGIKIMALYENLWVSKIGSI